MWRQLFDAQVVPAAVRENEKHTHDAQEIALALRTCSGVCSSRSGQQESQTASLPLVMYVYQR